MTTLRGVLPERLEALCCVDDGLAGDATADEAGTASLVTLDHYRLQSELRGPDSGHIATGPRSDDQHIALA